MCQQIKNPETIKQFIFAGNATFTLKSTKTGTRFTYKVSRDGALDSTAPWFVSVLNGPDNWENFAYIGIIQSQRPNFLKYTFKSKVSVDAPSFKALSWFLAHIGTTQVEFWHEGRCARCGRKLTVPESIATGFGPECAAQMGIDLDRSEEAADQQLTLEEVLS